MAQGGQIGNGMRVGVSASSPLSFTKLQQVKNVPKFFSLVANDVDTTVHSNSNIMTSGPGMNTPPEVEIELLADMDQATGTTQETLRGYQANNTTVWWLFEVPANRGLTSFRPHTFQAYIKEFTLNVGDIAAVQTVKLTLKYAGNYAVATAGASTLG